MGKTHFATKTLGIGLPTKHWQPEAVSCEQGNDMAMSLLVCTQKSHHNTVGIGPTPPPRGSLLLLGAKAGAESDVTLSATEMGKFLKCHDIISRYKQDVMSLSIPAFSFL